MHYPTQQQLDERNEKEDAWESLVSIFNPSHFITLTAPDGLFLPQGSLGRLADEVTGKAYGKTNALPPIGDRVDVFRDVIKRYFLMLGRQTSQHIRILYEVEMSESRKVKAPHAHGFVKWETSPELVAEYASRKYTMLCEKEYRGQHKDKIKSLSTTPKVGVMREYVPRFHSTDAMNALWCDFLMDKYGVYTPSQPLGFQFWSPSLSGAGYTFVKHDIGTQDGTSSDIALDICPRKEHQCNKKGRVCPFSWEGR